MDQTLSNASVFQLIFTEESVFGSRVTKLKDHQDKSLLKGY